MLAIVDYGVGNLFSLKSSLYHIGVECEVTGEASRIEAAERVILPGVGAFGDAMDKLRETGLIPVLQQEASKKPFLGICLGMQLLFRKSYEYGEHAGLGLLDGEVADLRGALDDPSLKVPHMGWNSLDFRREDPWLSDIPNGAYVYYVHSFYAKDCEADILAMSQYGNVAVPGIVRRGNVCGTQFHPEKSGETGLNILRAFAK